MRKFFTLLTLLVMGGGLTAYAQINVFPYNQNLESLGQGPTGCGNAQVLSIDWTNETNDDIDWVSDANGTGSSNTGPTANGGADHNPGVSGGIYLYTEASGCAFDTANLVSPEVQTDPNMPNLFFEFWYHEYGADINALIVQTRIITGGSPGPWVGIDTLVTPQPGLDQWQQALYDFTSYVGDTFQVRLRGVTGTSFGSDLAIDDLNFYSLYQNDAGVISIDAPNSPVPPGMNNVSVTLQNFGVNTLTNASIEWSLNGAMQTPFAWTGSVPLNNVDGPVMIGSANFNTPVFRLKAWTSMPNMSVDSSNGNDTTEVIGCTGALSGVYTLGGASPDFDNFTDLGFVLSTCGIDSHTIINVAPGMYMERLVLDHVPGTGPNATLTINGGNANAVTLSNPTFSCIYLLGTDYTTIKHMTLEALGSLDNYGVQLADTAEHNTIDSCRIIMDDQITNLSDVIGVSASGAENSSSTEGQNALWTTVSNCYIFGGEKSIHFEGQNALRTVGNRFINNRLVNAEDYGFYMDDQDSLDIIGNRIEGLRLSGGADAIYMFDIQMFNISNNIATNVPDYGLYISDGNFALDGTPTSRGRIVNNMISSVSDYALYLDDFETTDIFHNTFASVVASATSYSTYMNDVTGLDIRNNIFFSDNGYALYSADNLNSTPNTVNYNCYFTNGPNLVYDAAAYGSLAAWQTGQPTLNTNSVSGDPVFLSPLGDIHVLAAIVNDAGDNSVGVTTDVDGDARPASATVDIGADEFTPTNDDAVAVMILEPGAGCGDSNTVVSVVIRNLGQNAVTSLPITVDVTGAVTQTLSFTYTGTLGFNQHDTVIVGTINTYNGGYVDFSGFVALTGDQDVTNDSFPPRTGIFFTPVVPQGIHGVGCGVDSAYIYAAPTPGSSFWWFANPTDTVPLALADSFLVPSITTQNTYYLQYANNSDSLETTFQGGNSCGGGTMFDVTTINTINITGLQVNTTTAANNTFQVIVHWIPNGSHVGNETNPGAWPSSIGPFTATSAGNGNPSFVDFQGQMITIPGGSTYGMYIEYPSSYTNGSFTYSNSDLSLTTGIGLCGSFSGTNNPRSFNGRLLYGSTACSDIRVPVSAYSAPGVTVDLGNDTTVCAAGFTLDAGNPGASYLWSTNDTTQTISAAASGNYSVVVSDTAGCGDSDDINLTISTPPSVNLGSDVLLCDGAIDTLDAGNPGSVYSWSTGGTGQMEVVSAAGTVIVIVTDSNSCQGTDTVLVTTGQSPVASFNFNVGGAGLTYNFSDISTGVPTAWSWNFGDGNTDNTQNPAHTYAAPGSYTVTLTVTNDCGTDVFTEQVTVVSVEQALAGGVVSLYPNPNNGRFNLEFRGLSASDVQLRIMDVKGQVVMETAVEQQGSFVKEIDMMNFSKGMYLLQITAEDERIMQRFVVE